MDESIQLESLNEDGDGRVRESTSQPAGILRRARTDVHMTERPEKYAEGQQRAVAWSASLPASRHASHSSTPDCQNYEGGGSTSGGDWQHTLGVRRRQALLPGGDEQDAEVVDTIDVIARAMEGDEKFMADDMNGEVSRRNAFRELTEPLAARKEIKRRLTDTTRRRFRRLTCWQAIKYRISMHWYRTKENLKATFHDYSLWHGHLKVIEGIFGAGVAAYFRFLRYLLLLNIGVAALLCGFVLTPQLLSSHVHHCNSSANTNDPPDTPFGGFDWLTGDGWFLSSELYYSGYTSVQLCSNTSCTSCYDMRLAYICTVLVCFLLYLIVIARRVIHLYKEHTLVSSGGDVGSYLVSQVFTAWDFGITDEKAAKVKHSSIRNELTALSSELYADQNLPGRWDCVQRRLIQGVCWLCVIAFTALVAWFVYVMLDKFLVTLYNEPGLSYASQSLRQLVFPLIVTALLLLVPLILEHFVKLERYGNTRLEVAVTLARTTMLELLVLAVLVGFWYLHSPHRPNGTELHDDARSNVTCWEASLGSELYRLTMLDFLVQLVGSCCIMAASVMCSGTRLFSSFSTFSVSRNTLHLVYSQTLLWAALFFSPLLTIVTVVKLVLLFYIQKAQVVHSQRPPDQPWRAAQTETVFFALTLVSLVAAALATGFVLVSGCSSASCGPWEGMCPYVSALWGLNESSDSPALLLNIIAWLTKPGVVAAVVVCLLIGVYWARSIAMGRAELVCVLRHQLELEVKDRAFLLALANRMHGGQQCRGLGGTASPSSHCQSSTPVTPTSRGITRGSFIFSPSLPNGADGDDGGEVYTVGGADKDVVFYQSGDDEPRTQDKQQLQKKQQQRKAKVAPATDIRRRF